MKKTLIIFSSILLLGCTSTNDLIYSQDEALPLTTDLDQSVNSHSKLLANGLGEVTLMDLNIERSLINPDGGGCTFTTGYSVENIHESTAAFGPNPLSFLGYTFRGYGKPRTDGFLWKGIRINIENLPKTTINRGQTTLTNNPQSNAISIEHPFKANVTYQITLKAWITDHIWETKNNNRDNRLDDDDYDVPQSEGFPTVGIELANSPTINGDDPCEARPFVQPSPFVVRNYYKSQKVILTKPYSDIKEMTFNFSTKESKNAFIIYFLPELAERGAAFIPKNAFKISLSRIKIVEKPFDPSHVVTSTSPCNNNGGFRCP
ncbi:hypothetical protein SAMN05421786_11095 [Chryseobacterium ureilyticum]|uniref:Lipoprotein n=1 Tax=Chryseobacterium ureilyticum TaxID=373668 RepID=A0A1N7QI95_9FLAO|nr:hypothetical protein [Chryseobacterium ureilyticum]SIT22593.1 hypothetical protein SAMN05421786_11095 [Chryseobacterium ureilyticum]